MRAVARTARVTLSAVRTVPGLVRSHLSLFGAKRRGRLSTWGRVRTNMSLVRAALSILRAKPRGQFSTLSVRFAEPSDIRQHTVPGHAGAGCSAAAWQ